MKRILHHMFSTPGLHQYRKVKQTAVLVATSLAAGMENALPRGEGAVYGTVQRSSIC